MNVSADQMNKAPEWDRIFTWTCIAVMLAVWVCLIGGRTLIRTDEGRYALIALEMFRSGDWVTPHLNDLKYFEKPPLQYWMTALAYKLLGVNEFAARCWTGLSGLIAVLFTYLGAKKAFDRPVAVLAAAFLLGSLYFFIMGHFNALDMGFTAMMTVSLWSLVATHHAHSLSEQRLWALMVWVGMALAVLSKGLAGVVLPGAVLVLYSALHRDIKVWQKAEWLLGPIVFLLITAPWFYLVTQRNPEFFQFFFIEEHFNRFLKEGHRREAPFWYFIPIVLIGLLPWVTALAQGLWQKGQKPSSGGFNAQGMLWVWSAFIFLFFSLSKSKLPSYVLPVIPALTALAAVSWKALSARARIAHLSVAGGVGLVCAIGFTVAQKRADVPTHQFILAQWLVWSGLCLMAGSLAGLAMETTWAWRKRNAALHALDPTPALLAPAVSLAVGTCLASALMLVGYDEMTQSYSMKTLVKSVWGESTPAEPVYSVQTYNQSLPFYLKKPVILVNYQDEFALGLSQEPFKALPSLNNFERIWIHHPQAWALIKDDTYQNLKSKGLPMVLRFTADDHVLVSRK